MYADMHTILWLTIMTGYQGQRGEEGSPGTVRLLFGRYERGHVEEKREKIRRYMRGKVKVKRGGGGVSNVMYMCNVNQAVIVF